MSTLDVAMFAGLIYRCREIRIFESLRDNGGV